MRVALVGCGRWGALVLRDLRGLGCEVPVVARSEASVGAGDCGGAARSCRPSTTLPPVDAVVVATTTSSHPEVLDQRSPLGVPVFVEKPLCSDPAVRGADRGDRRLTVSS